MSEQKLVKVCSVAGQVKAHLLKARLEAVGIPVLLGYESAGLVFGLTVDGLGEVRILVPASRAEEAKEILCGDEASSDQEPDAEPENPGAAPEAG